MDASSPVSCQPPQVPEVIRQYKTIYTVHSVNVLTPVFQVTDVSMYHIWHAKENVLYTIREYIPAQNDTTIAAVQRYLKIRLQ